MIKTAVLALAATSLVAACSSTSSHTSSSHNSGAMKGAGVRISVSHGTLVAPNGHTLYANTADSAHHLICTGSCLNLWPPLMGMPQAGPGVQAAALGTIARGSQTQVTFHGHPLYEFSSDSAAGDRRGAGITDAGGTWQPVAVSGGGAASPATSKSGGGGYGGYP